MKQGRNLEAQSDNHLIEQLKAGNAVAYRQLFDKYYADLIGTAINVLRDKEMARDVVQEVFVEIWKKRESLEIRDALAPYLKRAVINRSINQIRRQKRFAGDEDLEMEPATSPNALDALSLKDLEEALKKALESLPERCRLVFVMKRLEGLSLKEIAEQLDISPKTAENQITKAIKLLSTALKNFRIKNDEARGG